jgi:hypothetical protein
MFVANIILSGLMKMVHIGDYADGYVTRITKSDIYQVGSISQSFPELILTMAAVSMGKVCHFLWSKSFALPTSQFNINIIYRSKC